MSIVVLASATGAPGVTTTALGLTLQWPTDVLLVDCDRDPAQVIQAGYLRGVNLAGRGLLAVSRAHREGRPLAPEVWHQAVALATKDEPERRYLPGFTHPGSAALFTSVWGDLGQAFRELGDSGADVVVDAGRVGREGLPLGLLEVADAVLVVTRSSLRALAALRLHLPMLVEAVSTAPGHGEAGLLLVGDGMPYSAKEIHAQFGVSVWASISLDTAAAAVLTDGEPAPRRFAEGAFNRSLRTAALGVTSRVAANAQERAGTWAAP